MNTFFMMRGEITLTLEDVGHILTLQVFGNSLLGLQSRTLNHIFIAIDLSRLMWKM